MQIITTLLKRRRARRRETPQLAHNHYYFDLMRQFRDDRAFRETVPLDTLKWFQDSDPGSATIADPNMTIPDYTVTKLVAINKTLSNEEALS